MKQKSVEFGCRIGWVNAILWGIQGCGGTGNLIQSTTITGRNCRNISQPKMSKLSFTSTQCFQISPLSNTLEGICMSKGFLKVTSSRTKPIILIIFQLFLTISPLSSTSNKPKPKNSTKKLWGQLSRRLELQEWWSIFQKATPSRNLQPQFYKR